MEVVPCRICLADSNSKSNPLISPCLCSGTMRCIHVLCLKEWLDRLDVQTEGNSTVYTWTAPVCELCKTPFPLAVEVEGQDVNLLNVIQPNSPFLVLKIRNEAEDGEQSVSS